MTSIAQIWWDSLPRRLANPAPVLASLWNDGAQWKATPLSMLLPALGVLGGTAALAASAAAPQSAAVLTSATAAAAVLVVGCASSQAGLLAFMVAALGGVLRASSPREAAVGATMTFLLAVLIPTAARNVAAALPGGPRTQAAAAGALGAWLVYSWMQAAPLARSLAVHGSSAGDVPGAPVAGAVLPVVAAALLLLRSLADELAARRGLEPPPDVETASDEHRVPAAARAVLGAGLLLLPWSPLLRDVPPLLVLCVMFAVALRLIRSGHAPALAPRSVHSLLEVHAGAVWIALAAISFGIAELLGRLRLVQGTTGIGICLSLGLALAVLTEVPRRRSSAPVAS